MRSAVTTMAVLVSISAYAASGPATVDGVLQRVDADHRWIVVAVAGQAGPLELSVPEAAKIRLDAKAAELAELPTGCRVWGWYDPKTRHVSYLRASLPAAPKPAGKAPTAKASPAAPCVNVWELTYDQRVLADARRKPLPADSLVLPFPDGAPRAAPRILAKGARFASVLAGAAIWQILPQEDLHKTYLDKRERLLAAGKPMELIRWCAANDLPACAAFEARAVCQKVRDFNKPAYKQSLPYLLRYTDTLQSPYSFPLPVEGVWYVAVDRSGHHRLKFGAAYAFDLVIRQAGRLFAGAGRRLTDYYGWGKPVCAQADGVVSTVRDDHSDNPIGRLGAFDAANYVGVNYGGGVYGFYGHIQQGSAKVKPGQRVKAGDVLALVGNSGASGSPHLHFTMTDAAGGSLKGRFTYDLFRNGRWRTVAGEALVEGAEVRNSAGGPDAPLQAGSGGAESPPAEPSR